MKDLWWDESLSLQRAEEALPALLRGVLLIRDGFTDVATIDQHPFFSFLLQGALLRGAGDSEFVLRYISAMAATLLIPVVWVWGRWLVRRSLAPASTPIWAVLLAAVNPFMLWFGQEARPYALWATLALLSTYLLVRATEAPRLNRGFAAGFVVTELMFVATHFFASLLLPLHALILFLWLARRSLGKALVAAALVLAVGGAVALYGAWVLISQGGGGNFASISLAMLIPDIVNAFSLGLSVDLADVWWIDVIFGLLALTGAVWSLRSRSTIRQGGWILPAFFLAPIALLLGINWFRPLYMTARHMSLLAGAFVILTAAGIAVVWQWRRWVAGVMVAGLVIAIAYSTVNYFTLEKYAKDDYTRLGEYMDGRMMPGDAVLLYQSPAWRIFEYYVPIQPVYDAIKKGAPMGVFGIPLLNRSQDETITWLQTLGEQYQRIWMLRFGDHLVNDPEGKVEEWLQREFPPGARCHVLQQFLAARLALLAEDSRIRYAARNGSATGHG